ncbi:hypothetical protein AAHC03_05216 [Spirometra sp. Aus1]
MPRIRHPSLEQTPTPFLPRFSITRTNPPSNTTSPGEQTPVYLYQRQRKSSGLADEESSHYSVSRRFAAPGGAEKRLSVVFSGMNLDESDRKSSLPTSTGGRLLSPPPPGLVTRDGMGSQDLRVTDGRTRRHSHHSQTRQRRESGRQTASSVCTSPSDVPPSAGKDTVGNHRISSVTGNSATVTGDPQSLRRLFPEMSQKVKPLAPGRHERRYSQTKDEQRSLTNGSVTSCSNELKNIGETPSTRSTASNTPSPAPDSKSGCIGRFVVLKAAVSNVNESATPRPESRRPCQEVENPQWSFTLDDNNPTASSTDGPALPGTTYWTVTSAHSARNSGPVVLTAPGARNPRKLNDALGSDISRGRNSNSETPQLAVSRASTPSTPNSGPSSRPVSQSVHNRFRKFLVESFGGSRVRTHSEQQTSGDAYRSSVGGSVGPNPLSAGREPGGLPPHAHTITAATSRSIIKGLLEPLSVRTKDDAFTGISTASSPQSYNLQSYPSVSVSSVNESYSGSGKTKNTVSRTLDGHKRKSKPGRRMVHRLLSLSNHGGQKPTDPDVIEGFLPDPSKLPREAPQSTLEFTQSRLKNLPRRSVPDTGRKGKKRGSSNHSTASPRAYLLQNGAAKSEDLLLRSLSQNATALHTHARHHQHGHRPHHYRHGHYPHSHRHHSQLTRVTENSRYLMFTKASPFRSPNEYLQTRGKGMSDSETYFVLFQHTTCYKLMPDSAKLVTLDSQLPVGKAFRALCINGIRAAPVWDSGTQSFTCVLTINDFLQMLSLCWKSSTTPGAPTFKVEDCESMPIGRWKEICAESESLRSSQRSASSNEPTESKPNSPKVSEGMSAGGAGVDDSSILSVPSQLSLCCGSGHRMGGLTVIQPNDTLYTALSLLAREKLHRLPVFDLGVQGTGNPLFVLTHRSLLAYLYRKQSDLPRPKYLQMGIKAAGVGTYENLALVTPSTKLVDALTFFEGERVSVLPVVDSVSKRRMQDIFAKFDVITLILAGMYKKPDMTVQDVLDICKKIHRGVIPSMPVPPEGPSKFAVETCLPTDTIQHVINKLMQTGYHRLIIVDNHQDCRVEGVVSISDLLYYMVLRQPHSQSGGLTLSMEAVKAILPDWQFLSADTEPVRAAPRRTLLPFEEHDEGSAETESEAGRQPLLLPEVETLTQLDEHEGVPRQHSGNAFRGGRQDKRVTSDKPLRMRRVTPSSESSLSRDSSRSSTSSAISSGSTTPESAEDSSTSSESASQVQSPLDGSRPQKVHQLTLSSWDGPARPTPHLTTAPDHPEEL